MQKAVMHPRLLIVLFGIVAAGLLFLSLMGAAEAGDGSVTVTVSGNGWGTFLAPISGRTSQTVYLSQGGSQPTGVVTAGQIYHVKVPATVTIVPVSATTAPTFTAQTPPSTATVGSAYGYTFAASGEPAPTYAVASGTLPVGLALDATSGLLAGTPTTAGVYSFRISATNSAGSVLTPTLTISVAFSCTAPSWGSIKTSHSLTAGSWYSHTFAASGSPTPSYSLRSGSIPAGMRLSSSGSVSGTPTAAATYSFTLYASNSCGTAASPTITMNVAATADAAAALTIQAFPQPMVVNHGQLVSYRFVVSGGTQPYRFYQSGGTMPAGLSLSEDGLLSGTVLAWPGQDFIWYLSVIDGELNLYGTAVWMRIE